MYKRYFLLSVIVGFVLFSLASAADVKPNPPHLADENTNGTTLVGVQIEDRVVMFNTAETTLEKGQFAISGPGVYHVMVCGLEKSTPYYVSLDGGAGVLHLTTEGGLLVFELDLAEGKHTVAISINKKTKCGDVNGDGKITAFDAVLILQHVAHLITLSAEAQTPADVSNDDIITVYDAILVLQRVVGLIDKFPREEM